MDSTKSALISFLQHTGRVNSINAEEIADHFVETHIAKHVYQLKETQVCNYYLFLEEGFMRAYAHNTEGLEVTTGFYAKHQLVFEVSSFFNRTPSLENIQALTDCTGYYLTYEKLNALFHAMPAFREFGRSILVKGFSSLKIRTLSMITETAEERYANLLKYNPEIFQYASLKYIASYLGITDTSLSRIRKDLTKR